MDVLKPARIEILATAPVARAMGNESPPLPNWLAGLCRYIDNNATEDLTLNDLATQAQVTPRALQYAFRQYLSTSPMRYLRQQKLIQVNQTLKNRSKRQGITVTQAAVASGFTNLGVFARYYRQEFGELPSRTRRFS